MFAVLALAGVLVAAVPASAEAASDYALELQVEGTQVRVSIAQASTPVGAIEIQIIGLSPLAAACEVTSGIGACVEVDGIVRVSAINPTGWAEPQEFMSAEISAAIAEPDGVELVIRQGTDVNGIGLEGSTSVVVGDSTNNSGFKVMPVAIAILVAILIATGTMMQRRRTSRAPLGFPD